MRPVEIAKSRELYVGQRLWINYARDAEEVIIRQLFNGHVRYQLKGPFWGFRLGLTVLDTVEDFMHRIL